MLAKTKLNTIEITVSRALFDLFISLDKFVSVSNLLREYNDMNEEIKNQKSHQRFIYIYIYIYVYIYYVQCCIIVWIARKTFKEKAQKLQRKIKESWLLYQMCSVWQ